MLTPEQRRGMNRRRGKRSRDAGDTFQSRIEAVNTYYYNVPKVPLAHVVGTQTGLQPIGAIEGRKGVLACVPKGKGDCDYVGWVFTGDAPAYNTSPRFGSLVPVIFEVKFRAEGKLAVTFEKGDRGLDYRQYQRLEVARSRQLVCFLILGTVVNGVTRAYYIPFRELQSAVVQRRKAVEFDDGCCVKLDPLGIGFDWRKALLDDRESGVWKK